MARIESKLIGLEAFRLAITRNPVVVIKESKDFLVRAMALYKKEIRSNPWSAGTKSGGGVPIDTGNLRDTHRSEINKLSARIYPTAKYAKYVHDGTSRMAERPWLDHAKKAQARNIRELEGRLLDRITRKLAK